MFVKVATDYGRTDDKPSSEVMMTPFTDASPGFNVLISMLISKNFLVCFTSLIASLIMKQDWASSRCHASRGVKQSKNFQTCIPIGWQQSRQPIINHVKNPYYLTRILTWIIIVIQTSAVVNKVSRLHEGNYRKISNIGRTLVGNEIVDHSDVIRASHVGVAPTTSSFST